MQKSMLRNMNTMTRLSLNGIAPFAGLDFVPGFAGRLDHADAIIFKGSVGWGECSS